MIAFPIVYCGECWIGLQALQVISEVVPAQIQYYTDYSAYQVKRWGVRLEVSDRATVRFGWLKAERQPEEINAQIRVLQ